MDLNRKRVAAMLCTLFVKLSSFFIDRDSTVNLCALDMSKALDKLNKFALFIKLINKKCPLALINILDCWYAKNFACVRWGNSMSPFVMLATGTRQGGITSPYLFASFINDVIVQLQKSGLGCHIRNSNKNNAIMQSSSRSTKSPRCSATVEQL